MINKASFSVRNILIFIGLFVVLLLGFWFANNQSGLLKGDSLEEVISNPVLIEFLEIDKKVSALSNEGRELRDQRLKLVNKYNPTTCENVDSYIVELKQLHAAFENYMAKLQKEVKAHQNALDELEKKLQVWNLRFSRQVKKLELKRIIEKLKEIEGINKLSFDALLKTLKELEALKEKCREGQESRPGNELGETAEPEPEKIESGEKNSVSEESNMEKQE